MNDNKALEALERLYKSHAENNFAPFPTRSDLDTIRLALTELAEIKKTMQEWLESKDWSESLAWETLHKINYILKGETK